MKRVAIVPVRGGSKGLPGKNTRLLADKPLWAHSVAQAQAVGVDQVIVTTDILELSQDVAEAGASFLERPKSLAQDDTPMAPVILHALETLQEPAQIVLLQATSPLRSTSDILQTCFN